MAVAVAALAIAFRVAASLLAFLTNLAFPDYQREQFNVFGHTDLFWDALARWDSGWYFQIARLGYHYTPNGRDTIAFMPAYPLLMRYVGRAFGRSPADLYLGGYVISWVAFACAMVGLHALASLDVGRRRAGRAVILTAVFPFAYFFGAVYTESLFLAAVVWTFYLFRTRRWIGGGLCGALATATRVNGILMLPALAWMVWRQVWSAPAARADVDDGSGRDEQVERGTVRDRVLSSAGLLLATGGIAAYSAFIYRLTGNPLEWVATIQRWGYYPGGAPWFALARLAGTLVSHPYTYLTTSHMALYDSLNGIAGLCFVAAIPLVWYRLGAAYGLFLATNLWLPLSSGQYEGLGRYCSVLFPFFVLAAGVPSRQFFTAIVLVFAMLFTFCQALFVNIHPLF